MPGTLLKLTKFRMRHLRYIGYMLTFKNSLKIAVASSIFNIFRSKAADMLRKRYSDIFGGIFRNICVFAYIAVYIICTLINLKTVKLSLAAF